MTIEGYNDELMASYVFSRRFPFPTLARHCYSSGKIDHAGGSIASIPGIDLPIHCDGQTHINSM